MHPSNDDIAKTILALCRTRGVGKTICPSEAARAVASDDDWRSMMEAVRTVATAMAAAGTIAITQGGNAIDPTQTRGPIRLGLPRK
ncbi:MAG: DUF3253 domain-containing protein [Pseudomonadota bacterium]